MRINSVFFQRVPDLKISLVTVTYNAESTIARCIESVAAQSFKNIEYIIIDGGSTDKTIAIINQYKRHIGVFLSEPDEGIYDAMNKGIKLATGDIIGTLNADDFLNGPEVLAAVERSFSQHNVDILYGDLDYVDKKGNIIRKWRSNAYDQAMFTWGWMPPHPTFYCKRRLFFEWGFYSLEYATAADYELMLRFMYAHNVSAFYLKRVMIKMDIGGASNKNYINRAKASQGDLKAMRNNNIPYPFITLILKPLRKLLQYL